MADSPRVATWTVLGDWQQAGTMHQPSFMMIHEMTGSVPCSRELWEANDAAEFELAISAKGEDWRRSASLRDCMNALMAESWSGVEGFPLKCLSLLDLHLMIYGQSLSWFSLSCLVLTELSSPPPHDWRRSARGTSTDKHPSAPSRHGSMAAAVARHTKPRRRRSGTDERVCAVQWRARLACLGVAETLGCRQGRDNAILSAHWTHHAQAIA
jgi:hypothetical protein